MPHLLWAATSWARLASRLVHVIYGLGSVWLILSSVPLAGLALVLLGVLLRVSCAADPAAQTQGPHKVLLFLGGIPSVMLCAVMQYGGGNQARARGLWFRQ